MGFTKAKTKDYYSTLKILGLGNLKEGDKIQILEDIYIYWSKGYDSNSEESYQNAFYLLEKDIKSEYNKSDIVLCLAKNDIVLIIKDLRIREINDPNTSAHYKKLYDFINYRKVIFKRI